MVNKLVMRGTRFKTRLGLINQKVSVNFKKLHRLKDTINLFMSLKSDIQNMVATKILLLNVSKNLKNW